MADFCLECFNKVFKENYKRSQVSLSRSTSLCEECCKYKRVVTSISPKINFSANKKTGLQILLNEIKLIRKGSYKSK